jgi:hypothetical protein
VIYIFISEKGIECCSDQWISFHFMSEQEITLLAAILSRHATRLALGIDKQKPTFRVLCDEYFLMERVSNEMGAIAKK